MVFCSVIAAWALGAAVPDPDLAAAEKAFDDGRYERVLPAIERALAHDLPLAERRRAFELKAVTAAAFDDAAMAVDAFRHLLGVEPSYTPDPMLGPKVASLFERARDLGPVPEKRAEAPPPVLKPPSRVREKPRALELAKRAPPEAHEESSGVPAVVKWPPFWAGVGAVAIAVGVGTYFATRGPSVPAGNLPTGALR